MSKKKKSSPSYVKFIKEMHDATPLRLEDFPESNRCDGCQRIAGAVMLMGLDGVWCLKCATTKFGDGSAQWYHEALQNLHPVSRDMAEIYKDQVFPKEESK